MPHNTNTTKIRGFSGLVNTLSPEELTSADRNKFPLLVGQNVYLTNARRLKSRPGFALATAGSYHSLWSGGGISLVAAEDELRAIDRDLSETTVRTGLTPNSRMSYAVGADRVFYMNAVGERGSIQDGVESPWGLAPPSAPQVTTTTGALPAGTYQVGLTQRLASGEESGVNRFAQITLTSIGGITVHLPAPDPDAAEFSIYCSQPGGKNLYAVKSVLSTATTATINSTTEFGRLLTTEDVIPPPKGTQIAYNYGRMYVVTGRYVYYSDPFAPGWFREDQFYAFPDAVALIAPVDGGIFVSADKTYFISGPDPKSASLDDVSDAQAVSGTLEYLEPGDADGINKAHAVWMSDRGFILGAPGGGITLLTEAEFTFAVAGEGSLNLVKQDGVATLIGLMESPSDEDDNFGMTDRVSAEVIRNAVV